MKEERYSFFILDPAGEGELGQVVPPRKGAFIFRNEERGVGFDKSVYPEIGSIKIPQFGGVESLNVSIAASVVMYGYVRQCREES